MKSVVADSLVKVYKTKEQTIEAVKGVSFEVEKGELFGIIGPDGSGKTSIFRMLTTLLLPDGGNATVDGSDIVKDFKAIRRKIGYMPGKFSLYHDLTIEENLEFFATIFNTTVEENYDLIKDIYVQIEPFKDRRAGKLSGGMKQKLALCCALIHRPVVLFLDEPTTGVDAVSRKEFWQMLTKLKSEGITIMVSTPYMDEAALCDRVALMQSGEILATEAPEVITGSFRDTLVAIKSENMFQLLKDLSANTNVEDSYSFGEFHHAIIKSKEYLGDVKHELERRGHKSLELETAKPNIEDCFMQLMKK